MRAEHYAGKFASGLGGWGWGGQDVAARDSLPSWVRDEPRAY